MTWLDRSRVCHSGSPDERSDPHRGVHLQLPYYERTAFLMLRWLSSIPLFVVALTTSEYEVPRPVLQNECPRQEMIDFWRTHVVGPFARKGRRKIVNAVLEEMGAALARRDRVELRGFGAFTVRLRSARPGHNPKNGVAVSVPAKFYPHLKPSKEMHDRLNRKAGS